VGRGGTPWDFRMPSRPVTPFILSFLSEIFNHGHREHGDKKYIRWLSAFKSLVFSFLCPSLASAVTDRRYRYWPPVTLHTLRLFLNSVNFVNFVYILQIDSLCSPYGLPLAVFLRCTPILSSCIKILSDFPASPAKYRLTIQLSICIIEP